MSNDTRAEYATTDILEAATLKLDLVHLDRITVDKHTRQGMFIFKNVPQEILDRFNTGKCLVEPCAFNAEIRNLKRSIDRISANV